MGRAFSNWHRSPSSKVREISAELSIGLPYRVFVFIFRPTGGRESFVDLLHDPHSPLNARGDQLVRARAPLRPAEQIVSSPHVQARQNRSHHSDYPFAALVHV